MYSRQSLLKAIFISVALAVCLATVAMFVSSAQKAEAHTQNSDGSATPAHPFHVRWEQGDAQATSDGATATLTANVNYDDHDAYTGGVSYKWFRYERTVAQGNGIGDCRTDSGDFDLGTNVPANQANVYKTGTGRQISNVLEGISAADLERYKQAAAAGNEYPALYLCFVATADDLTADNTNSWNKPIDVSALNGNSAGKTAPTVPDTGIGDNMALVALVSLGVAASITCGKIWRDMRRRGDHLVQ